MALTPDRFKDGDVSIAARSVELSVDLNGTGEFVFLCALNVDENFNDSIETWYDLCGEGQSNNAVINSDYEIPWSAKLTKGDLTDAFYQIADDPQARSNVDVRLDNTLMDVRTEFKGMISVSTVTGQAESIQEISGSIKVSSGKLNRTKGIPSVAKVPATGSLTIGSATATTIPFSYDFTLNDSNISTSRILLVDKTTGSTIDSLNPLVEGTAISGEFTTGIVASTTYILKMLIGFNTEITSQEVTTPSAGTTPQRAIPNTKNEKIK